MKYVLSGMIIGLSTLFSFFNPTADEWSYYGGDQGGQRYVNHNQIKPENVNQLEIAWQYQTGDLANKPEMVAQSAFEVTPILIRDSLVFCTSLNRVIALDPGTGEQKWSFDPKIDEKQRPANQFVCRGVAYWHDTSVEPGTFCSERIYTATNDARLISLDFKTGKTCSDFGSDQNGQVNAGASIALQWPGEYQITSAPVIARDTVIIGSAVSDNARLEAPSGRVKAYDARSGTLKWSFDPVPRTAEDAEAQGWLDGYNVKTGAANVWAPMSIDEERGLVFLPTSSPSPDFYGASRPGPNKYANAVVALKIETGEVVWSFQTVHHDIWDYDLPAQPSLLTLYRGGKAVDVVAQVTKTGFMFVLERDTGKPFFGVEERPVPQSAALGEWLSKTQPFPIKPPALVPQHLKREDMNGFMLVDEYFCKQRFDEVISEGLFTPPSEQGTVLYPFTGGGANWGGMAFDEQRQIAVVNLSRAVHIITLIKADEVATQEAVFHDQEVSPQTGAKYGMRREMMLSILGAPCNDIPWGELVAVDLSSGELAWRQTLGTTEGIVGLPLPWGTPNFGGPMMTQSGLIFIGATMDDYLRAFDTATGEELWKGALPAGGQATPMGYEWQGKQYVLIAAGGHSMSGTTLGDYIVSFALPVKP